jgi:glycine oxidase
VTVVEAGRFGRGATAAAAGVLAAEWSAGDPPELTALAADGLARWPEWAEEVQGRSGVGLGFRVDGLLNLWVDPEAPGLPADLAVEPPPLGERCERLSAAEARELEPSLTGPVLGAVLDPTVAQVDNPRLGPALARAATDLGARYLTGTPVVALTGAGGRCTGVRLAGGATMSAGAVVVAAGAWSGLLAEASGIRLPVEPWRGQMLAFDAEACPLRRMVFCGELVLVPRPHGALLVGTTLEHAGFDARVTLGGLAQILARAERVVPGLGQLPLARTWAGLRPGTPDHLPHLGRVPGWDGLFAAAGHGRKGLILAPLTGDLLARLIVDNDADPRLAACLPGHGAAGP